MASRPFALDSPLTASSPELAAHAQLSFQQGRPYHDAAMDLMHRIYADFDYDSVYVDFDSHVGGP